MWSMPHKGDSLNQGSVNLFCEGPGNIFSFVGHIAHRTYSTVLQPHESDYRQHANESMWLCPNKTLFMAGFGLQEVVCHLLVLINLPSQNVAPGPGHSHHLDAS